MPNPGPPGAFVMRNVLLTIEGTAYKNQVTAVTLTPDQPVQVLKMLDGSLAVDADTAAWTCKINGVQDYVAARGLARLLTDSAGTVLDMVFEPKAGGVGAQVPVMAVATPFGGEQGSWTTMEVELTCTDQPEWIDPVAP